MKHLHDYRIIDIFSKDQYFSHLLYIYFSHSTLVNNSFHFDKWDISMTKTIRNRTWQFRFQLLSRSALPLDWLMHKFALITFIVIHKWTMKWVYKCEGGISNYCLCDGTWDPFNDKPVSKIKRSCSMGRTLCILPMTSVVVQKCTICDCIVTYVICSMSFYFVGSIIHRHAH